MPGLCMASSVPRNLERAIEHSLMTMMADSTYKIILHPAFIGKISKEPFEERR